MHADQSPTAPRARGWTRACAPDAACVSGCPARAGMDLSSAACRAWSARARHGSTTNTAGAAIEARARSKCSTTNTAGAAIEAPRALEVLERAARPEAWTTRAHDSAPQQPRRATWTAATARQNEAPRTVTAKRNERDGRRRSATPTRCGTTRAQSHSVRATRTQTGMEPAGALGHAGKDQDATRHSSRPRANSRSPSSP